MKKKITIRHYLVGFTWLLFLCFSAKAQQTTSKPGKKIYIHYDKDTYVAGETIWFKAYFLNNGKPDGTCNNFYLQVFNPQGEMISSKKLPVEGATAKGSLDLPDSIMQGFYSLRGFTPAQLSAPTSLMYNKPVFVFNLSRPAPPAMQDSTMDLPAVQFYPEGGYLTEGVLSALVFETRDENGRPAAISGTIKMDDSIVVAPFKSEINGTGRIQIKPVAGKKYTAVINSAAGPVSYSLPEVKSSGVNIKIEDEPGGKLFTISRTRREKDKYSKLIFIAEQNGLPVYENEIAFDNFYSVKGHLVTRDLPSGLIRFALYNEQMQLLQERMGMIDNGEYRDNAEIAVVKKGTGKRGENIINIQFQEAAQRSCSVSVIALEKTDSPSKTNIITHTILGDVLDADNNSPAKYFTGAKDSSLLQAFDNSLLIAGQKNKPETADATALAETAIPDNYLMSMKGHLISTKTKQPVTGGILSMFFEAEDSADLNFEIPVDVNGGFFVDSLLFRGITKLHLGYTNAKGVKEQTEITIHTNLTDSLAAILPFRVSQAKHYPMAPTGGSFTMGRSGYGLSAKEDTKDLDPVIVSGSKYRKAVDEVNDKYTSGAFRSMGKYNFDNINQPENNRVLSVYDYVLRSVRELGTQDGNFINRRNLSLFAEMSQKDQTRKQDSLDQKIGPYGSPGSVRLADLEQERGKNFIVNVFVNESQVYPAMLKTITMDQVALVKFYGPGFVGAGGNDGPGGALAIYLKKEVEINFNDKKPEKQEAIPVTGYALVKKFVSPDYATNQATETNDRRKTLYWNPDIYTSPDNKSVELKFYHNDFGGSYKIILQGFDANGKLVYKELVIDN